jgi:hypothetical protein
MCHNVSSQSYLRWPQKLTHLTQIQDGRYHTVCGHFIAMSTRMQDCLRPDCLFSRRHEHSGKPGTPVSRLFDLTMIVPFSYSLQDSWLPQAHDPAPA